MHCFKKISSISNVAAAFFEGVEKLHLEKDDRYKLWMDGCLICKDEDVTLEDFISGQEIIISVNPPTSSPKKSEDAIFGQDLFKGDKTLCSTPVSAPRPKTHRTPFRALSPSNGKDDSNSSNDTLPYYDDSEGVEDSQRGKPQMRTH
jgi:hypothetical protein